MSPPPLPEQTDTETVSPRFGRIGWLLFLFVIAMVVATLIFGWKDAAMVVSRLSALKILILCALASLHYGIRAMRWHILVRVNGIAIGLWRNTLHLVGGFAMTATPGRLGELVRLRWLKRETGLEFSRLLPVAFADRAIELASILLLIFAMLAFGNLETNAIWGLIVVGTALVVLCCKPLWLEKCIVVCWVLMGRRKPRLFARLRRIVRYLKPLMHPAVLIPILLIGVAGWMSEGIAFWMLLSWLGIPLDFPVATAIFLIAILAGALSGLPGGFGGAEATGIALLVLQSIPLESAVFAILVIRLTTLWFAILVGLATFPIAEFSSSLKKDAINGDT